MRLIFCTLIALLVVVSMSGCAKPVLHTPLNDALVAGDVARIKALLDSGASLEEAGICGEDGYGRSPLHCAVVLDRPDLIRLLVERLPNAGREWAIEDSMEYASYQGKANAAKVFLDLGADVNAQDAYGNSPLYWAAYWQQANVVKLLIARGADVDYAISRAESEAAKDQPRYNKEEELAAVRMLKEFKGKVAACTVRYRPDPALLADFPETAAKYRALPVKPELPEAARIFRVQAEDAVARKRFQESVELYDKALQVAPWWPEGHFNQALILGETDCPEEAIAAMERYLALVPDAPDARAARDDLHMERADPLTCSNRSIRPSAT